MKHFIAENNIPYQLSEHKAFAPTCELNVYMINDSSYTWKPNPIRQYPDNVTVYKVN